MAIPEAGEEYVDGVRHEGTAEEPEHGGRTPKRNWPKMGLSVKISRML